MSSILKKLRSAALKMASKVPIGRRAIQYGGRIWGRAPQFHDLYSRELPSAATPFGIFRGAWSSAVPGFATGEATLFEDLRIQWLETHLGTFQGKRVLELGPLEGGHTFMMERAGANVIAIEANQRAFLKCLVIKDAFELKSKFLYGDFRPYLEVTNPGAFDFILAVGVLYHMLEPVKLLHDIARATKAFGLWTHYYDLETFRGDVRFSAKPAMQTVGGHTVQVYEQHYLSSLASQRFIGGSEPTSCWLTKQALLQYIESLGFQIEVGEVNPNHPNGPCILLFARRTSDMP